MDSGGVEGLSEFKSNFFVVCIWTFYYMLAVPVIILLIYNALILSMGYYLPVAVLGIIGGVLASIVFLVIRNGCIRVVVQDGKLTVYNGHHLRKQFKIEDCQLNSKTTTRGFVCECQLIIRQYGRTEYLNCTMLGKKRFAKLLNTLGFNKPIKINVG